MKAEEACKTCAMKKAEMYIELYEASAERRKEVYKRAERYLEEMEDHLSAPQMMGRVLDFLKKETNVQDPYEQSKKKYNQLLLGMEDQIWKKIDQADDVFKAALQYAVVGNYIDFGALSDVNEEQLKELLASYNEICLDTEETENLRRELSGAKRLVYITDNAGEIVLDKICIRVFQKCFEGLNVQVLVRGEPVLNDATEEDAKMVGLDQMTDVLSNGTSIPGTEYGQISEEAKDCIEKADLCIAKGQGNFESLKGCGKNIYYLFLCKCDLFVERFHVERLTPALLNELRTK